MKRPICLVALLVVSAVAGIPAAADPTDVINVPTAAIQRPGHYVLELVQEVAHLDEDRTLRTSFLTLFGITDRIEGGIDFNTFGTGDLVEGDIKYQLRDPTRHPWGFAVGATNIGPGFETFFYGVGTRNYGTYSLTLGVGEQEDVSALIGVSYPVSPRLTLASDWISDEVFTAGFTYKLSDHFTALVWYSNLTRSPVERIEFDLIYSGSFR